MANTVKVGEVIDFTRFGRKGKVKVHPPCKNKTGGEWYCVTHDAFLDSPDPDIPNQHHQDKRHCKMAWLCKEHGLEMP